MEIKFELNSFAFGMLVFITGSPVRCHENDMVCILFFLSDINLYQSLITILSQTYSPVGSKSHS